MLGLSVDTVNEWANRAYIASGVVAIMATAIALIASFFIWRTGAILSRVSDEKIAAANLEIERLRATNLQWQASLMPRSLDHQAIANALKSVGRADCIITAVNDPEAIKLAAQLASIMRVTGFRTGGPYNMMGPDISSPGYGVEIFADTAGTGPGKQELRDTVDGVAKAFNDAGLLTRIRLKSELPVNQFMISVGVRPWPGVLTEDRQAWPGPLKEIPTLSPAEPARPR